jgi:rhodanese-related sulfurtransferase
MPITTIAPAQVHALKASGQPVELIDVRTPAEFGAVHAPYARNVPLDSLKPKELTGSRDPGAGPIYVICQAGGRSRQACEKLQAAGFENVVNVDGGTSAWIDAGLPVVRGKKAISLERQVRIAAGLLVLVGSLLGLVYPAFCGLAAFVGAGLVFAGVTDTCGMGMLLARMPWNRGGNSPPTCDCG